MKYIRRTAGYTRTDYKTHTQIAKKLKITPILDKLLEHKRNWIQHINRMPRNRLPRVIKHYSTKGRRNYRRPLKRLLDTWDRNGSTSGITPWQIYDDDDAYSKSKISIFLTTHQYFCHCFRASKTKFRNWVVTLLAMNARGDNVYINPYPANVENRANT